MSHEADQAETEALKETVFAGTVRWFAGGAACVSSLMIVQAWQEPSLLASMLGPIVVLSVFPIFVLIHKWLGYPHTAIAFLAYLLLGASYITCERGFTPGAALAIVTFPVLSGLYFDGRGVRWASAATLMALLVSAVISTRAAAGPWIHEWWNPREPIVWLRYASVLVFFGGAIVWTFSKLHEGLAQQRAALRETLEREAAERARRERTQEALEQAQRLSALAQFAGGLAHDFNNSLMVIMSAAAMIEDDSGDARTRELAREITRGADVSAAMVRQLLTLGRPSRAELQRISIDALFQQCRSTLRSVLPASIDFHIETESQAELSVDLAGIQQALLNLTLNARDAMAKGGSFTLRAQSRVVREPPPESGARPGTFTVIACQDTGSGMDEITQKRVFEPFFTTKAAGKGTGLGLAMVQRLVRDSGGFVGVESAPGVGTTFHLHFPAPAGGGNGRLAAADDAPLLPAQTA